MPHNAYNLTSSVCWSPCRSPPRLQLPLRCALLHMPGICMSTHLPQLLTRLRHPTYIPPCHADKAAPPDMQHMPQVKLPPGSKPYSPPGSPPPQPTDCFSMQSCHIAALTMLSRSMRLCVPPPCPSYLRPPSPSSHNPTNPQPLICNSPRPRLSAGQAAARLQALQPTRQPTTPAWPGPPGC